ncbi:MAG: hypothetical protein J6P71_02955 [Oscillospiraceae bacterium]|nr:hypothetical protein [Oscillospiraceae bacterium]
MAGVDWDAVKRQQEAMNAHVMTRANAHPGKTMKTWKLLLIVGVVFVAMIVFLILLETNVLDRWFYGA